jgi:RNA polymerase sigma factor (sigma-70 family)
MALIRPFLRPDSLEDLFLERYDVLLRAALAITGQRREAEDLVQEAFVRVKLANLDLAAIEHLDAYLRTVLRNLHTARLRRRSNRAETPLSVADFDAAQFAARALTPSQWTQARHDVAAACRYACTRRLNSKTGSVFLLRFVHEFVPVDIARVARLTRPTVDVTLVRGRAEVRAYLEHPARAVQALGRELVPMSLPDADPAADPDEDEDYLARLRAAVFGLRHKRCFGDSQLRRLYDAAHDAPIAMDVLAELVTCPDCLDQVSRLTGVPPSAERHADAAGRSSSRGEPPRDARLARRLAAIHTCRIVRAHRPRLLRVLVNGFEVGTHEITGAAARVTQAVSIQEPVWLAEVYSEQDICLASLDVAPLPDAPAEQRVAVALADDRRIEITLSFLKQWPTLHLVYEDPSYAAAAAVTALDAGDADADADAESAAPDATAAGSRGIRQAWRDWLGQSGRAFQQPPRLAWWAVSILIVGWLFFFTPGMNVSAAEWLWRTLTAIVARQPKPAPTPQSGPIRQQDITLPVPAPPPPPQVAAASSPPMTPDALADLEIDALTVLHTRHALVGQRIQVTRTPTSVAVDGLVEGQDRDALVRALREVPHGVALRVHLATPEDLVAAPHSGHPSSSSLRAVALDRDAIPVADDLRQAIAQRSAGAGGAVTDIEAEIHRVANDGLRDARTVFLEAATLSALADRFDAVNASAMEGATSKKWRTLLAEQTDRVAVAVDRVRRLLEPLFRHDAEPAPRLAPAPPIDDTRQLSDEARRIAEELRQVERATRAALAVGESAPDTIELRDPAFWRRLAATSESISVLKRQLVGQ